MTKFYYTLFAVLFLAITASAKNNIRVISLSPSLTEIIFQLNKGDCLVGRSSASNYFKKAKKIPIVGDFGIPAIEQLIVTKPDVVITTALKDPSIQNTIKKLGIKTYILPTNNIKEYYHTVNILGKLLGAEKNADKEILRIKNGLEKYAIQRAKIPKKQHPTVFWEISSSPLMTIGNKSFLNDFIYYAGGRNITSSINKGYFNVSKEWVIHSAPDVIISPSMKKQKIKETKQQLGWDTTPAIKNNRIYGNLDPNLVYILGPRMLEAIQTIHKCLFQTVK